MDSWKEIAEKLTEEFMDWGCRFSRKQLPEIAVTFDCTPLFFWNWVDGETDKSEKGFLRVLGYAWKKILEEETESAPWGLPAADSLSEVRAALPEKRIAA